MKLLSLQASTSLLPFACAGADAALASSRCVAGAEGTKVGLAASWTGADATGRLTALAGRRGALAFATAADADGAAACNALDAAGGDDPVVTSAAAEAGTLAAVAGAEAAASGADAALIAASAPVAGGVPLPIMLNAPITTRASAPTPAMAATGGFLALTAATVALLSCPDAAGDAAGLTGAAAGTAGVAGGATTAGGEVAAGAGIAATGALA